MKPRPYVQIQAVLAGLAVVVVLIVLGRAGALAASIFVSVGLAIWLFFLARYTILVKRSGDPRTRNRRDKDRVMLGCLTVGLIVPAVLAWLEVVVFRYDAIEKPLLNGEAVVASLGFLAVPFGILVSSAVDWYLIRPFREGVCNEPVCRPEVHEEGRGMDYARYWIMHRMVSEFTVYAGIVVLIGLFFAATSTLIHSEEGKAALGFVGAVGIAVWSISELSGLRAALTFVRYPQCELGSWATGRTADCVDIDGFVLDVSINPGVQLIGEPRGHPAPDIAKKDSSVPLRQAHNIKRIDPPLIPCSKKCEFWVPDCEVGLRELEDDGS